VPITKYDCHNLSKGTGKKEENVAFSAAEGSRKKGPGKRRRKGNCNNCGKPSHWAQDCWEEGGRKEGQKPNFSKSKGRGKEEKKDEGKSKDKEKSKGKDSAASAKTDPEDAAWMALSLSEPGDDNSACGTPFSGTSVTLNGLLKVDEVLQQEFGKSMDNKSVEEE
jgi:hypothetical protein